MKPALSVLLKTAISAALIWLFLRRIELADVRAAAQSVGVLPWLGAAALFLLSNLLGSLQWGVLLRVQGIELRPREVVSLYFVGVFFNNFLVSNIGGDAVRIYDLKRLTGRASPAFAATFLDRFVGLFVLIFFSATVALFTPAARSPAVALPIATLAAALVGVLCFGFSRRLSGAVLAVTEGRLPERIVRVLRDIRAGFILYRRAYAVLVRVGMLAAAVQLGRVGVYYLVGRGMGLDAGFESFVVFVPLIAIVAAVPVSFGGIGVRENVGALLFGRVGVGPAEALAMMFLGYLAGIAASLLGGGAFILRRTGAPQESMACGTDVEPEQTALGRE